MPNPAAPPFKDLTDGGALDQLPDIVGRETFSVRVEIIEGWVRIYLLSGTTW